MGRINIEDSLYKDLRWQRFSMHVGDLYRAKGMLLTAWTIAQDNWIKYRAIPIKAWPKELDPLIDFELAVRLNVGSEEFVYVKGSKEQFRWIEQRSKAGSSKSEKKIKSAEKARETRKNKKERVLNGSSEKHSVKSERSLNETERKETGLNGSEPPTHSLTLSHALSLSPSSGSVSKKDSVLSEHSKKAQLFIGTYCQLFKARHGSNPKILGKDSGIAGRLAKQLSDDDIKRLLTAFFSMPDSWLFKAKHPIAAFEMKLNEIVVFANSGNFTTKTQAQQADAFATNAVLLDQVRRGEV